MRQDLLKTGRDLVDDDQEIGSERLNRPDPTGLKGSRHARLSDHVAAPADELSLEDARLICGQVTRAWLGDFAPALVLLDGDSRRRLQAVLTLTRTAIDFALQPGVEGERVSALNRLQFEVEAALDGNPRGQPAHLLIAELQRESSWSRASWDALFDRVQHLGMIGILDTQAVWALARSVARLISEDSMEVFSTAIATVLRRIERWRTEPTAMDGADSPSAYRQSSPEHRVIVSAHWSRFAHYVERAERRLSKREARGCSIKLGLATRLGILARARLSRVH